MKNNNDLVQSLGPKEIHLWLFRPTPQDQTLKKEDYNVLSDVEITKIFRVKSNKNRNNSLKSRSFARNLLSRYIGCEPSDINIKTNKFGKPYISDNKNSIKFNISHCNDFIICGLSKNMEIGCDIESLDKPESIFRIADRFFSDSETKYLSNLESNERKQKIIELWTLKESLIKAAGKGLRIPLNSFSFDLDRGSKQNIPVSFNNKELNKFKWSSSLINVSDKYKTSVTLRYLPSKFTDHSIKLFNF